MEQPQFSNSSPPPQQPTKDTNNSTQKNTNKNQKMKMPTPKELITHYETQGMSTQEASIKVIDDLQHMLFRVVTSGTGKKNKFMGESSRKLDAVNARLSIIEAKLDSKPGFPGSFAVGFASAAALRGVAAVWPQVASAAVSVWKSVKGSTQS